MALTSSYINDQQGILNHDLEMTFIWSKQWLDTFNPNKTEMLYFGNQQPPYLVFNETVLGTIDNQTNI